MVSINVNTSSQFLLAKQILITRENSHARLELFPR